MGTISESECCDVDRYRSYRIGYIGRIADVTDADRSFATVCSEYEDKSVIDPLIASNDLSKRSEKGLFTHNNSPTRNQN